MPARQTIKSFFKSLVEYLLFKEMFKFAGKVVNNFVFIIASLLYPFYAVTFGILANVGGFQWKGKIYKNK